MPGIPLQVHQSVFIPPCEKQKADWIYGSKLAAEFVMSSVERHSGASSWARPRHAGASCVGQNKGASIREGKGFIRVPAQVPDDVRAGLRQQSESLETERGTHLRGWSYGGTLSRCLPSLLQGI